MKENLNTALAMAPDHKEVAFPKEEFEGRLTRIRAAMSKANVDLIFISSPEMQYYVSGFQCEWYQGQSPAQNPPTSGIAVHVDHDRYIHFETPSETMLVATGTWSDDVRIFPLAQRRDGLGFIQKELKAEGWLRGKVGMELRNYRPNPLVSGKFRAMFEAEGMEVVDVTDLLAEVRRIKSELEIEAHFEAARIADIGLKAAIAAIAPGVRELEVWGEMIAAMAREGGEMPAIIPPVASGFGSNCLHRLSSTKEIRRGERVWLDTSGVRHRYHSNTARTCWVGDPPDDVVEFHNKTIGAFDIIRNMLKPGMEIVPMLEAVRNYYSDQGILEEAYWSGGYELGIAFPPDWVGSLYYDLAYTAPGDVFAPMTVVNHECNFFGPRGTGQSATIDTIIFERDQATFGSTIGREIQVIRV